MSGYDDSRVVRIAISQRELDDFKVLTIRRGTTVPRALAALVRWSLKRAAETPDPQTALATDGSEPASGGNR